MHGVIFLKKSLSKKLVLIFLIASFFCCFILESFAQSNQVREKAWIDSVFLLLKTDLSIDTKIKCELADSIFHKAGMLHDTCSQVYARVLNANYLDNLGFTDSALVQLYWANQHFLGKCDSLILMKFYTNLTSVYISLNEYDRLDSAFSIAMKLWNPRWQEKEMRFAILTNKAIADINRENTASTDSLFHQIYTEAKAANNTDYIKQSLMNLGGLKGLMGDLDSSYFFLTEASKLIKFSKDINDYILVLINLASLDMELGRFKAAEIKLDSAFNLAAKWDRLKFKADVQNSRAELFAKTNNFKKHMNS